MIAIAHPFCSLDVLLWWNEWLNHSIRECYVFCLAMLEVQGEESKEDKRKKHFCLWSFWLINAGKYRVWWQRLMDGIRKLSDC